MLTIKLQYTMNKRILVYYCGRPIKAFKNMIAAEVWLSRTAEPWTLKEEGYWKVEEINYLSYIWYYLTL